MKVALLGPIAWRTPPLHYGPWELITSLLAEGLAARGVDVTLFATLDSVTKATLDGVCPTGYEESPSSTAGSGRRCTSRTRCARSGEFDLVHNHLDWLPLAFSAALRGADADHRPRLLRGATSCPRTGGRGRTTSRSRTATGPPTWTTSATVYHGIDLAGLPFDPDGGDDLVAVRPDPPGQGHRTWPSRSPGGPAGG